MLFVGLLLLTFPSSNITSAFIGVLGTKFSFISLLGFIFMISSFFLLVTTKVSLEEITLRSSIKKNLAILRLTNDAVEDKTVEREINHLIRELKEGNFEAGLGHPGHIEGTDIFYLRGRNGGRLYYHRTGENSYEIVGKSAKGRNQGQVIDKLKKLYIN